MTYTTRCKFNTHEVHDVREVFKNVSETIPELGLKMEVDGKPFEMYGKTQNYFRFKTSGYTLTLMPAWVANCKQKFSQNPPKFN